MNYVEWCELILTTLGEETKKSQNPRGYVVEDDALEKIFWGEKYDEIKAFMKENDYSDVIDYAVIYDLKRLNLVERHQQYSLKSTLDRKAVANNLFLLWKAACDRELPSLWEKPNNSMCQKRPFSRQINNQF